MSVVCWSVMEELGQRGLGPLELSSHERKRNMTRGGLFEYVVEKKFEHGLNFVFL